MKINSITNFSFSKNHEEITEYSIRISKPKNIENRIRRSDSFIKTGIIKKESTVK